LNRDLRWSVEDIRLSEKGMDDKSERAKNTVSFPSLREGNIGLIVATQIARYVKPDSTLPGWHSQEQAWAHTQGQLAWYRSMEEAGELVQIKDKKSLQEHLSKWESDNQETPIGYILSLEGADSLVTLSHLERAYQQGLRAVGPAHYGPGVYAMGTDASGELGSRGREMLKEMERLNIILDATHLCDDSFWEAMDLFNGPVWASHNNCRRLVNHNRQFSDEQIKALIEKNAVIGIPLDAGNADHVGIGTDLDGGYGKEQCPADLDTIADMQNLVPLLQARGYDDKSVEKILSQNFLDFLLNVWY
jgi:membrane dipeptidase